MGYEPVHVAYTNPGWSVRVGHEALARSHHSTKQAAMDAGRALARQMQSEVVVREVDGSVSERQVYGSSF